MLRETKLMGSKYMYVYVILNTRFGADIESSLSIVNDK